MLVGSLSAIILAAALAAAVLYLNFLLVSRDGLLHPTIPAAVAMILGTIPVEAHAAYHGLLIAVATVVGLFLTLYITNTSAVAGSIYPKLPNRLRRLYLRERVGNLYIRFLITFLVFTLFILLVSIITGFAPTLALILIVFLSALAVQSFVALGARAFQLFDPSILSGILYWRLNRWISFASTGGFGWRDKGFQAHFQVQTDETLKDISALVQICSHDHTLKAEPLSLVLTGLSQLIRQVVVTKRRIPSSSEWYAKEPKHRLWYLSEYFRVDMATRTQTDIGAEFNPDRTWIEARAIEIHMDALESQIGGDSLGPALNILPNMVVIFSALARDWEIQKVAAYLPAVSSAVIALAHPFQIEDGVLAESGRQITEILGLIDTLGSIPVSMLLDLVQSVEAINIHNLRGEIGRLNWSDESAIYKLGLPSRTLHRLEFIRDRLLFERKAEGETVTAEWYVVQLIFQELAFSIESQLDNLISSARLLYEKSVAWQDEGRVLHSVQLISRGLEFGNKVQHHFSMLEGFADGLEKARIEGSIPWPDLDWTSTRTSLDELMHLLHVRNAQMIPKLSAIDIQSDLPDYFGRATHMTGENCFQSLVDNDQETFSKMFVFYFLGIYQEFEQVRIATSAWNPQQAVPAFSQPLLDLMELSGYSYFFAEFHDNPMLWSLCEVMWKARFEATSRADSLQGLAAVISYNTGQLLIAHRSALRTRWKMTVNSMMNQLPRKVSKRHTPSIVPRMDAVVTHESRLVRVFGGTNESYPPMYDGLDIFVDLYLKKMSEAAGLDFGNTQDIQRALDWWKDDEEAADNDEG